MIFTWIFIGAFIAFLAARKLSTNIISNFVYGVLLGPFALFLFLRKKTSQKLNSSVNNQTNVDSEGDIEQLNLQPHIKTPIKWLAMFTMSFLIFIMMIIIFGDKDNSGPKQSTLSDEQKNMYPFQIPG